MRAGVFLAYWPWFSPEEQVGLARLADEHDLDSVWISEAWGQDAVSVLGLLAGKTERIALLQIPARPPYVELADRAGHGAATRACQEAFLGGDRHAAAVALTLGL